MTAALNIVDMPVDGEIIKLEIRGEGPTVIFLHGWSLDRRMWHPQVKALTKNYRVVLLDRRGFGESSAPPDLEREVKDILAIQQELNITSSALIGMSQGGRIALRFAHQFPEKLWALSLISAPLDGFTIPPTKEDTIPIELYRSLAKSGDIDKMRRLWSQHPIMHCDDKAVSSLIEEMLKDYEARDLMDIKDHGPCQIPQIAQSLGEIKIPTLIINGEFDTKWRCLVGKTLDYGLHNSRRKIISDAGHLCNLSHSTQVNSALLDFLDRHRPIFHSDKHP